jgi:hypothetical protein
MDRGIAHYLRQTAFLILDEVIKVVNRRGKLHAYEPSRLID